MKQKFLSFFIWCLYRLWSSTWRLKIIEPDSLKNDLQNKTPVIFSHWHGDELVLVSLVRRYKIATIASTSKDGELMSSVIQRLGGVTSRGSSTRAAVSALKGLIRLIRLGHNCSFAVDGPKGPLHKVKAGVFETSRVLHAPIYAGGVACSKLILFKKSWNQTYIPLPFARVVVVWGGPFLSITKDQDPRDSGIALELERLLRGAKEQAIKVFAGVDP